MPQTALRRSNVLRAYVALVTSAGLGVVIAVGMATAIGVGSAPSATAWLLVGLVVLGELLPMRVPGRGDDEVTLSTSFSFALLLVAGGAVAVLAQAGASLLADGVQRKPLRVALFNAAQYALAFSAASLVVRATTNLATGVAGPSFEPTALPGVLLGALVFFGLNQALAGTVQALAGGRAVVSNLARDVRFHAWSGATLLGLAPLVVVAAEFSLWLVPLLGLPLAAVYRGSRQAVLNHHQALHDALTGLPNRALLRDRLEQAILVGGRDACDGALMLLDLDRFKDVNDSLGHAHGDELLRQVGPRLRSVMRATDTVARLGGDEFAILVPAAGEDSLERVAAKVVEAIELPFDVDGVVIDIGASLGIARYPRDADDADELLQCADAAMYQAKGGGTGWELYDAGRDGRSRDRLTLAGELRGALEQDELVLHYQPKVDLRAGDVRGVEALVCWRHPRRGLLRPADFMPLAERTGLVRPISAWVLDEALRQAAAWRTEGSPFDVAVSLSARSLLDPGLPAAVAAALARHGVEPRALELDVSESSIMIDPTRAREGLQRLREIGVRLAIDDFGVGRSSLAHLGRLPVDEIKVDRSFVAAMDADPGDAAIVQSTVEIGRSFGLGTVAEGVENAQTLDRLTAMGCDGAQGLAVTEPLPARDVPGWAAAWRGRADDRGSSVPA